MSTPKPDILQLLSFLLDLLLQLPLPDFVKTAMYYALVILFLGEFCKLAVFVVSHVSGQYADIKMCLKLKFPRK